MGEHLDALVLAQVDGGVLVDCLCLSTAQILHHQAQCLLIRLHELWLGWVLLTGNARWQHVVDWCLLSIFLQAYRTSLQGTARCSAQLLVVGTPLATYEVEGSETQHDRLLETRQEHTHEADAGEIVDVALTTLELIHWDAELIPSHGATCVITQGLRVLSLVNDMVASHHEVFRADAHMILEVLLILIEGIVLVDVLHIRG